jgi:peptidoglycan/LPS O-acetylase OafA/YrhL
VAAVIGFYLISGYVMAGLVQRHYASVQHIGLFYADRALRLFPQYLFYAGVTLAWQLGTGGTTLFLAHAPAVTDLLNNLLVIPLNYYMVNGADRYTLIPPAWSLGAELQFYIVAPLMLLVPRLGVALGLASLVVHVLAWHGELNTDWFGYRLLPGVLWVFAIGMAYFHLQRKNMALAALLACIAPVLALLVYLYLRVRGLHVLPYNTEVLVGWGGGLLLLHLCSRVRPHAMEGVAGDLSYGVFLNHFLIMWLLPWPSTGSPAYWAALATLSVAASWVTQRYIERPAPGL